VIEEDAGEAMAADWARKATEKEAKSRRSRRCAALVFLCVGAFAGIVGAHDAFSSLEVASRFGGLLLLFAGLSLIAVAVFLFAGFSWAPVAGILISPVGMIIGLSFVSAQLLNVDRDWWPVVVAIGIAALVLFAALRLHWGSWKLALFSAAMLVAAYGFFLLGDHDERLIIWAAIVFASVLACVVLWRMQPPRVSISAPRVLGGMAGFFTLSALIGGAQLWYTSQYLPESLGASLSVQSHLTREGVQGGEEVVKLTLSIQNTGQTQAKILASLYRVTAAPVVATTMSDRTIRNELDEPAMDSHSVSRFRHPFRWDVVQAGRIFAERSWLDPEERYVTSALVYLPRGRYDVVRSKSVVLLSKGKALTLDEAKGEKYDLTEPKQTVREVASVWPIEETSWFRQLTRSDRELKIDWITSRRGNHQAARFPYLSSIVFRVGSNDDAKQLTSYNEQLGAKYGLAEAEADAEMPLDPPSSR
jgi:MFS family permease